MTKVKICGITNLEDAELSVKFGADALGFNFYGKSPRYITPEAAAEIIAKLTKDVLKVGVFVNETLEIIVKTAAVAGLDAIQLHGEETPEFLSKVKEKTKLEVIKAFRVSPNFEPEDVLKYDADAILLDAYNPKEHGGTGETFDWDVAKNVQEIFPKMYLAGGIKLENVASAVCTLHPFFVDVCSGIEREKGLKDRVKTINLLRIAKYRYETSTESDIYRFFWSMHPQLKGLRLSFDGLEKLVAFFNGYCNGWARTLPDKTDFYDQPFFGLFYRNRTDPVSGWIDETLPEVHLCFRSFVFGRFHHIRGGDWFDQIIAETGLDGLDALCLFFALIAEYEADYERNA